MSNEILHEIKGQILFVTFNRPERKNALNIDLANHLFTVLKNATTDRGIRAVVLRGQGGTFMEGLDMQPYTADVASGVERANQMMQPYNSAIRELVVMEKPVIAAVEGWVAGPGLSFMLAADLVIAARGTKFNAAFASYAMTPDGAASLFLTRKVGPLKANELLMLSETFDAEKAEKLGLVNWVVDDAKLAEETAKLAERLASGPTRALGAIKILTGKAFEQNVNPHIALEHTYWGNASRSFDFREAIKAMAAKRDPKYTGA